MSAIIKKIFYFFIGLLCVARFVLVYFFMGMSLAFRGVGWLVRWPFQTLSKCCDKIVNFIGKGIGPQ